MSILRIVKVISVGVSALIAVRVGRLVIEKLSGAHQDLERLDRTVQASRGIRG